MERFLCLAKYINAKESVILNIFFCITKKKKKYAFLLYKNVLFTIENDTFCKQKFFLITSWCFYMLMKNIFLIINLHMLQVFYKGVKKPVFFVASRGHHADIGGSAPGSMPPFSRTIFEEGAVFKSFYLVKNGEFQEEG